MVYLSFVVPCTEFTCKAYFVIQQQNKKQTSRPLITSSIVLELYALF